MNRFIQRYFLAIIAVLVIHTSVFSKETNVLVSQAPLSAQAYIISPNDGDVLSSTFTVKFGLSGMGIAPAGVNKDKTGHHHLLVDINELPDMTLPLPATEKIKHFGGGQTEAKITLPPGTHTLQLVLGNFLHIPHSLPIISEKITVRIK